MSKAIVFGSTPEQLAYCAAAAAALGAEAVGVTVNPADAGAFADCGAGKVVAIEGAPCIEAVAGQVAAIARSEGAEALIAASGYEGQTVSAMAAGILDWPIESDVSAISGTVGDVRATRLMYGGAVTRDESVAGPVAITLPAGVFDPAEGPCEVEAVPADADGRYVVESVEVEQRSGSGITSAKRVLGIGMGLRTEEDLELAKKVAAAMGAEIGGTRGMAEERGWLDDYIGISGLSIQPDLYLSLAVAGQIQHVFGIRGSKVIAAVDINKDAPIFKACDYGIVGDFHEVAPLIAAALS